MAACGHCGQGASPGDGHAIVDEKGMKLQRMRPASVLVMMVFVIALISAVVIGMLEIVTEEVQLVQNHIRAAQAVATAEAGLNDAFAELRTNPAWSAGFTDKPFDGGAYSVAVNGSVLHATGTTSQGYVATMEAQVTVSPDGPPHMITIDRLRINE